MPYVNVIDMRTRRRYTEKTAPQEEGGSVAKETELFDLSFIGLGLRSSDPKIEQTVTITENRELGFLQIEFCPK